MLNFSKENKTQLDEFIQKMHEFLSKWNGYLKEVKLDDNYLSEASNEATGYLEQLNQENQFLFKLFNGNVLKFLIISLKFSPGSLINDNIQTSNLNHLINLNAHLKMKPCIRNETLAVKLLGHGKISAAYRKSDSDETEIVVFDKNFNRLCSKVCIATGRNFKNFQLNALANNSIIFCLTDPKTKLNFYNSKSDDEFSRLY